MADFLALFRPAPHLDEIQDPAELKSKYRYWRVRTFYSMFIGYAFFYFTRKSFTFAMPILIRDLGFTKGQLGILISILPITYGLSKFVSGIIADRSNPRFFMAIGLIATGVINLFFGFSSTMLWFTIFWAINGWFQGWGWPPCARYLTHWYSQSERGRWWAAWNTSHNVGGAIIAILAAYCAQRWGWRWAMYIPGVLCIGVGIFLINRLRDTPQSLGLPAIEKYRNDYKGVKGKLEDYEKELSVKEILFKYVLKNKFIWILAIANFFVYVVRNAMNDWSSLFLVEEKGYSAVGAGTSVSWFEIGGFFGSLFAGWMSDKFGKGNRGPTLVIFSVGVVLSTCMFWWAPASLFIDSLSLFMIGMWIFGPQMLIGMAAAELAHKKAAATASGFTGWIGYLGAAASGYPLGKIMETGGWESFFKVIIVCGMIAVLLFIPLWKAQKQEEEEPKLQYA